MKDRDFLTLEAGGFSLHVGAERHAIAWDSVERIVAYKRDLLTVDLVCLDFDLHDLTVTINEEVPGWVEVTAAMAAALPLRDARWLAGITSPAFAPNVTVLFDRTDSLVAEGSSPGCP